MRRFILLLLGLMAFAATANAQSVGVCGQRDNVVERLGTGYQEYQSGMGMSTNGSLLELFTSENGTWTMMMTQPDGVSCLIAAGKNWETFEPKVDLGDAY